MTSTKTVQSTPPHAVAPGQQRRLKAYDVRIAKEEFPVIFDDKLLGVCLKWAKHPEQLLELREYLNQVRSADGRRFSRSYSSCESMMKTVEPFYGNHAPNFTWNSHFQRAKEVVLSRYKRFELTPITYRDDEDVLRHTENRKASTGFYGIETGIRTKGEFCQQLPVDVIKQYADDAIQSGSFNDITIFGTRSQASGELEEDGTPTHTFKWKTRAVWVTNAPRVYSELRFAHPLSDKMQAYPHSFIGKSDADITHWCNNARTHGEYWLSLDYSKYDGSIPGWLIHEAFDVLRASFPSLNEYDVALLKVLERDFIHKRCLLKGNEIVWVHDGVPSGSAFTSLVDGICNELITETWAHALGVKLAYYAILGDDNLIYTYEPFDVDAIASYIRHNFGVVVNVDKTDNGGRYDDPRVLSRIWRAGGPYRHPAILCSHMWYPERYRVYKGNLTPELVFYSYILGYRRGMDEWFASYLR